MKFVLGGFKPSRPLYLPKRNLKVYMKAITGFDYVISPDGLNITFLSPGHILEIAPTVELVSRVYIPKMGRR